jgi:hypothetical protein
MTPRAASEPSRGDPLRHLDHLKDSSNLYMFRIPVEKAAMFRGTLEGMGYHSAIVRLPKEMEGDLQARFLVVGRARDEVEVLQQRITHSETPQLLWAGAGMAIGMVTAFALLSA